MAMLNDEFGDLVRTGRMELRSALEGERDHLELPRLVFEHTRSHLGRMRLLIDRLNGFSAAASVAER
jgi:hypothetical protein